MSTIEKNGSQVTTEWFYKNFQNDFLSKELKCKEYLNEPRFSVSQGGSSSRLLNHWYESGFLEDRRPKGKGWRKLTFTETIWIDVIRKLRKFGLDLKKILIVKECLDEYNDKDPFSHCPLLDFFITESYESTHPIVLIVFTSGKAIIGRQDDIDLYKALDTMEDHYITIDLSKIVKSRFKDDSFKTDYLNYSKSTIEKEVVDSLTTDSIRSLSIKVNKSEYIVDRNYVSTSQEKIKSLLKKISSHFEETRAVKGNQKIFKLTEKKKIKR